MECSLIDYFTRNPGNYLIYGEGGVGKTTSLINFAKKMVGRKLLTNHTVIPIYIKLSEYRFKDNLGDNELVQSLRKYFKNSVDEQAIIRMIEDNDKYLFLFLLDGINELSRLKKDGDTSPTEHIQNSIATLIDYPNVRFIVSSRSSDALNNKYIQDKFTTVQMLELSENIAKQAVKEEDWNRVDTYLQNVIRNPMMFLMFRKLYANNPDKAISLQSKYELIEDYIEWDSSATMDERRMHGYDNLRRMVINEMIPYIAYRIEAELMKQGNLSSIEPELLLEEAIDYYSSKYRSISPSLIIDVLKMTETINADTLEFTHDIIRAFFAAKFIVKNKEERSVILEALKIVADSMIDHEGKGRLLGRTEHLDLAEFLYESDPDTLIKATSLSKSERDELLYHFYYELAFLYDDLKARKICAEVGWKAIDLFSQAMRHESHLKKASQLTTLFYCVNSYVINDRDPLYLLDIAAKEMSLAEDEQEKDRQCYYQEKARLISNIGSYYTSPYCKEYETALCFHEEALRLRNEYKELFDTENDEGLIRSYRTLMSDYYYLHEYAKAYDAYCKGLESLTGYRKLSDLSTKANIPYDIIERVIGSEIKLLEDNNTDTQLKDEIVGELQFQIQYVYKECNKTYRKDTDTLNSLRKKAQTIKEWINSNEFANPSDIQNLLEIIEQVE